MNNTLGGKNGMLKCSCGNLRYSGVKLCPSCYFSKVKYYVFNGLYTFEGGYDGSYVETTIKTFLVKAISGIEAIQKIDKINSFNTYGNCNSYSSFGYVNKSNCKSKTYSKQIDNYYIAGILESFNAKQEAQKYIKEEDFGNE